MPPNVVLIPTQGLANRFRALASARILADYYGTALYVLWAPEEACNCELTDVVAQPCFSAVDMEDVVKDNDFLYRDQVHTNQVLEEEGYIKSKWLIVRGGHEFKHPAMSEADFVKKKKQFYSKLKPIAAVEERVQAMGVGEDCVGLHFRKYEEKYDKADGRVFDLISPMEDFLCTVKLLRRVNPQQKIYLSTKHKELKQLLQEQDGGHPPLSIPVSDLDRNSRQGIEEAMVDWWALTKCGVIFGTDMSSFSDEAAICGDCPKVCIGSDSASYHCYGSEFLFGCRVVNLNVKRIEKYFKSVS